MNRMTRLAFGLVLLGLVLCPPPASADQVAGVPVLVYHRFHPTTPGSTTITTPVFESQMKWLVDNQYTVIPLRSLIDALRGQGPPPPPKSVVITVDDGHGSVYTDMLPIIRKYSIPVTLFICPSIVANARYALSWDQLKEMQATGLVDIQSHTYFHPNFLKERKTLSAAAYQKLLDTQLKKARMIMEEKLGTTVDILAWPFGIFDEALERDAEQAGYIAAFSIIRRHVTVSEPMMALPRYGVGNSDGTRGLQAVVAGRQNGKNPKICSR